jgi:hypothetical protein
MFEIGNSLREARVRQGLDHPQVELATKIRAKYIRAIEDEHFEMLPSETYVKGFLRSYAEFLGLDGQLYVDEYNSRYVVDGFDDMPARRASPRIRRDRGIERKVVLLALAGIAALTALVIVAWRYGGGSPSQSTPPVLVQQTPPAPVGLAFTGPGTYLTVRRGSASGPILYQGTLQAGEPNFVAGRRFWLAIRHAHRLRLTLGGRPLPLPARKSMHVLVGIDTRTKLTG